MLLPAAANGFYERDGFHTADSFDQTTRPKYVKEGTTTYYSYIYDASDADIWSIADIPDPDGTYTAIPGETSGTYTTTSADVGNLIKVGITLTAETGFTAGSEILSSPTAMVE